MASGIHGKVELVGFSNAILDGKQQEPTAGQRARATQKRHVMLFTSNFANNTIGLYIRPARLADGGH